jgi:hypothetical protein
LELRIQEAVAIVLGERWTEFARKLPGSTKIDIDWAGLQVQMEREVARLLKRELQSEPMLVFLMQNPDAEGAANLSKARRQSTPKPEPKRGSSRPAPKEAVTSSAKPAPVEKKILTVKAASPSTEIPVKVPSSSPVMAEAASTTTPTGRRRTRSSAQV